MVLEDTLGSDYRDTGVIIQAGVVRGQGSIYLMTEYCTALLFFSSPLSTWSTVGQHSFYSVCGPATYWILGIH